MSFEFGLILKFFSQFGKPMSSEDVFCGASLLQFTTNHEPAVEDVVDLWSPLPVPMTVNVLQMHNQTVHICHRKSRVDTKIMSKENDSRIIRVCRHIARKPTQHKQRGNGSTSTSKGIYTKFPKVHLSFIIKPLAVSYFTSDLISFFSWIFFILSKISLKNSYIV